MTWSGLGGSPSSASGPIIPLRPDGAAGVSHARAGRGVSAAAEHSPTPDDLQSLVLSVGSRLLPFAPLTSL